MAETLNIGRASLYRAFEELEIDAERLKDDARLREDRKIDSLDFVDIAVIVEEHFKIKIKPEEMKNVKLLSQFYDYIENKMTEA